MFSKAYRAVVRFAEECVRHGIKTTLTAVDHPDVDLEGVESIAQAIGAGFRARGLAAPRGRDATAKGEER